MTKINTRDLTPQEWLLVGLANALDQDGLTYLKRLAYAKLIVIHLALDGTRAEMLDSIHKVLTNYSRNDVDYSAAFSAMLAIYDVHNTGETKYKVALDSINSGAQIQSALTRCETGMKATGLINTGKRPDVYTDILNACGAASISRVQCKAATVPSLYGSIAMPKAIFGDDVDAYTDACHAIIPGAMWLRDILMDVHQEDPERIEYKVVAPDRFTAHLQTVNILNVDVVARGVEHRIGLKRLGIDESYRALAANVIHFVDGFIARELTTRLNYDPDQLNEAAYAIEHHLKQGSSVNHRTVLEFESLFVKFGFLSSAVLPYIKLGHLKGVSKKMLHAMLERIKVTEYHPPVITDDIFDSFSSHPNDCTRTRDCYCEVLNDLYRSNWLTVTLHDLTGEDYTLREVSEKVSREILTAVYPIT